MIAIPNMEKPQSCWECRLMDGEATCLVIDEGIPLKQEGIYPDCPLIEIDDEIWEALKPKVETMSMALKGWVEDVLGNKNGFGVDK